MSEIIILENDNPKTFFAPKKDKIFIYKDNISSLININNIKKTILKKEIEIKKKYKDTDDGDTGLKDSLTSRFLHYNLYEWPGMSNLKSIIKKAHDNFRDILKLEKENKIYSQCWANVMRYGEKIKKHSHYYNSFTYLGGHISIQTDNTSTHYVNPYNKEIYSSKNEIGKITLFPNWIEHYTDIHEGKDERITIAFDIVDEQAYNLDIFDDKKYRWLQLKNDN